MSKRLNRYARRKRDKKLDFIKGCHRKNFRLERYVRTYNAFFLLLQELKKIRYMNLEYAFLLNC